MEEPRARHRARRGAGRPSAADGRPERLRPPRGARRGEARGQLAAKTALSDEPEMKKMDRRLTRTASMRTTPVACATPALASRTSLDDKTDATPAWFTASGHGHARAGETRRSDARMARGFLRVALLALALCLAVDGGDASPVTKSEIGSSAGATRKLLAAHQYRMREKVPLYANKAGPFHNPSEVRRGSATSAKPAPTIVVE